MKSIEDITFSRKTGIKLVIIVDLILVVMAVYAFITHNYVSVILLGISAPLFIIFTITIILQELGLTDTDRFRRVDPLTSYESIQGRAKQFLELPVPYYMDVEDDTFSFKCIKFYAENGRINLTEQEVTRLSMEIIETGISSQELGDEFYYERERVAVIENILSERAQP